MQIKELKKLYRYTRIYGISRSVNKACGRLRIVPLRLPSIFNPTKNISIIGCGQFAFSTIAYFLSKNKGKALLDCYDIVPEKSDTLSKYYQFDQATPDYLNLIANPQLKYLYIASNHASHTPYAIEAVKKGIKSVYIEKPISTSLAQFIDLIAHKRKYQATFYAGYNRPYSQAISLLSEKIEKGTKPITLNCFIVGHFLEANHWYRLPDEGTRICGNVGHWLDLSIHLLSKRTLPKVFNIQIAYSNQEEFDDNIAINITTDFGDLISIIITARAEPFEGINETINFQQKKVIAKIDDFRKITIWEDDRLIKKRFFPKDVGHKKGVLQPFHNNIRDWQEVEVSTLLMLFITDMVRSQRKESVFDTTDLIPDFERKIADRLTQIN